MLKPNYRIKVIVAGKILQLHGSLEAQGIANNQQVMAVIAEGTAEDATQEFGIYDRVQKARQDALLLMKQDHSYMTVSSWART